MDQYKRMALFAEVVELGSLTAAAKRLGMSPSAVSQQLRQLEATLGLALLRRTTRKLSLTEAGERFHTGCAAMVAAAKAAERALATLRDEPEGDLLIAAPVGFAPVLAAALAPLRAFPKLHLHLLLDDARVDLIEARIDIALRLGALPDSSLVARRLGELPRQLCAAPAYLAERGWPTQPQDLMHHDWLGARPSSSGGSETLVLQGAGGERQTLRLESRVQASQLHALHALCLAGWGIGVAMSQDDIRALADGRLLPVLPQWRPDPVPVYAVLQRRDDLPAKVRQALELLDEHFKRLGARAG